MQMKNAESYTKKQAPKREPAIEKKKGCRLDIPIFT